MKKICKNQVGFYLSLYLLKNLNTTTGESRLPGLQLLIAGAPPIGPQTNCCYDFGNVCTLKTYGTLIFLEVEKF